MNFLDSTLAGIVFLFYTNISVKIPFVNKGMEFIDLPSAFRDKLVQSAVPNYFKNCEVPIICYKYNIHIRSAICF